MLITYFPESPMEYIEAHNSYTFQGTSVFEAIEIDSSFIENKYIDGCVENYTCSWGGTDHPAGGNCTAAYITVDWTCANSGGGGSGSSSSGSGNSPSNIPDPIITTPNNTPSYEMQINICFSASNSSTTDTILEDWFSYATYMQNKQVANYLSANGCSVETQSFVLDAMVAIMDGGEVDSTNRVILDSTFVNNVQLKCVYDKLTADNNTLFKNTIGAFVNDPNFNLTFRVGECQGTDDQCTNDSDPNNIVITFEDVNINPIEMAQAILHEAIHAELARFVALYQTGIDINNREYLFQLYAYYKGWADAINDPDYNWSNAGDHQYMITNYIDNIASALRQFDDNRYPIDNYKDYSWDGLRAYDYRGLLSDADEDNYINLRVTETNLGIEVCN